MLTDGRFWVGVIVGVGGVYAYNRWVRNMPSKKV